jgi:hypothetical protein
MNRLYLGLGLSVLILGGFVKEATSAPLLTEESRLSTNGIGSVHVGMTVTEAEQASGRKFYPTKGRVRSGTCVFVSADGLSGVDFMVINGKVVRVDVSNPRITTLRGVRIQDSEAQIKKLYSGQIKITPNPYRGDHFLTFYPKDQKDRDYRLIFEMNKGKVYSFIAGKIPAVDYSEGCV